jgi:hypothetical protein
LPEPTGTGTAGGAQAAVSCRYGDVHVTLPQTLAELAGNNGTGGGGGGGGAAAAVGTGSGDTTRPRVVVCGIHACDFLTDAIMDASMAAVR